MKTIEQNHRALDESHTKKTTAMLKRFHPTLLPGNVDVATACEIIAEVFGGKGAILILLHEDRPTEVGVSPDGFSAEVRALADFLLAHPEQAEKIREKETCMDQLCREIAKATRTKDVILIVIQSEGSAQAGMTDTHKLSYLLPSILHRVAEAIGEEL